MDEEKRMIMDLERVLLEREHKRVSKVMHRARYEVGEFFRVINVLPAA